MAYPTDIVQILGLWMGFVLTVAIYSLQLYKENPLYRLAEHMYIGIAFAIVGITAYENTVKTAIVPLSNGEFIYIIPIFLGLVMYTIFWAPQRWLSRYSVAVLVGCSLGVSMPSTIIPGIINQVKSTINPSGLTGAYAWGNFLFVGIGTLCSLLYFILTYEHSGPLVVPTKLGRYALMLGLGTMFGNTVLFRMSMLTGRVEYLLQVLKILPM